MGPEREPNPPATGAAVTAAPAPTDWTLTPLAPAERPLLERLAELYLYDFTDFTGWHINEDGRYGREGWAESLWSGSGRHALLLRVGGRPAGFAIVDERSHLPGGEDRRSVAEFFVMRAYRRRGYGAAMARALFDRFPGGWHVLQMRDNRAAQAFWRRVIADATGGRYDEFRTEDDEPVQSFDTRDRATR